MTPDCASARKRAEARGRYGEWAAAALLTFRGFRILARRHRSPVGEIDLIAQRRRMVVFVEVSARRSKPPSGP